MRPALFRCLFARSAKFSGEILKLREPVPHGQDGFDIADVDARAKLHRRKRSCKDVNEARRRVIGHQMASTFPAVLPLAQCRLLERANMLRAVTRTAPGFQSVKALTGPPDHERHERQ